MHGIWRRLFKRVRTRSPLSTGPFFIPVYFLVIFGRKRSQLTVAFVEQLNAEIQPTDREDDDAVSASTFFTCFSVFQENSDGTANEDLLVPLLGASHSFLHYISNSNLQRIAMECLEKMNKHFAEGYTWNSEDTMGKYLCPGLGWEVRPDETGPNVLTTTDMSRIAGLWRSDLECSDDPGPLLDVMEMAWFYKKAARLVHHTEVRKHIITSCQKE